MASSAPPQAVAALSSAGPLVELAPASNKPEALTVRYRPRRLAQLQGQPEAVATLAEFIAAPYPCAFILAGATGTGKSSAAYALAGELGCDLTQGEFGGVFSIPSGEHTAAALKETWPYLYSTPFYSARGWKVLIVNEVEELKAAIEQAWLDRLEDIPPKTVIVFTTNALDTLPDRFVDRCIGGVLEFRASADDLAEPARALARSIWHAEVSQEIPADVLERVVKSSIRAGTISFRRIVQALVGPIMAAKARTA